MMTIKENEKAYLAKLNRENAIKLGVAGMFNAQLRIKLWISHLSKKKNFKKYFSASDITAITRQVKIDGEVRRQTIVVNKEEFDKFRANCKDYKMSANFALNEMVADFAENGELFEIKVWA